MSNVNNYTEFAKDGLHEIVIYVCKRRMKIRNSIRDDRGHNSDCPKCMNPTMWNCKELENEY